MKHRSIQCVRNAAVIIALVAMPLLAAPVLAQTAAQETSVELGNVDSPESEAAVASPTTSDAQAGADTAQPFRDGAAQPVAEAAVAAAKPAATPMEKYRDTKLLQAATPNGVNPATARRYLRVDRATYLDSVGGVQ